MRDMLRALRHPEAQSQAQVHERGFAQKLLVALAACLLSRLMVDSAADTSTAELKHTAKPLMGGY